MLYVSRIIETFELFKMEFIVTVIFHVLLVMDVSNVCTFHGSL
jgi:hypothetical protein